MTGVQTCALPISDFQRNRRILIRADFAHTFNARAASKCGLIAAFSLHGGFTFSNLFWKLNGSGNALGYLYTIVLVAGITATW